MNESGGTAYPSANGPWALEVSLDGEWAHTVVPGAGILLVEATTSSLADLLTAEDYATPMLTAASKLCVEQLGYERVQIRTAVRFAFH